MRRPILTPSEPDEYELHIALGQEEVGWFDERDRALACTVPVEIRRYGWTDSTRAVSPHDAPVISAYACARAA